MHRAGDGRLLGKRKRAHDFKPLTKHAMKNLFLALALLALLGFAIAVTSGTFGGPSDIEMRIRASEPFTR
jgi:hypothetical protein